MPRSCRKARAGTVKLEYGAKNERLLELATREFGLAPPRHAHLDVRLTWVMRTVVARSSDAARCRTAS